MKKLQTENELTKKAVMSLCMPLAYDELPGDSEIWSKIKSVIMNEEFTIEECLTLCQSFSYIEGPRYTDSELWTYLEKKFGKELNDNANDYKFIAGL